MPALPGESRKREQRWRDLVKPPSKRTGEDPGMLRVATEKGRVATVLPH